jgi:hypothetical protein
MRSYVKLYGPPVLKALMVLEKLAVDTPEVCIMDSLIETNLNNLGTKYGITEYFKPYGGITEERCNHIISKSGGSTGDYDFYFEWFVKPTTPQLQMLIGKIDEALKPVGVRYTVTTKN